MCASVPINMKFVLYDVHGNSVTSSATSVNDIQFYNNTIPTSTTKASGEYWSKLYTTAETTNGFRDNPTKLKAWRIAHQLQNDKKYKKHMEIQRLMTKRRGYKKWKCHHMIDDNGNLLKPHCDKCKVKR